MKRAVLYLLVLSVCGSIEQKAAAQMPVADDATAAKPYEVSPATAANLDAQIGDTLIRLIRSFRSCHPTKHAGAWDGSS